MLRMKYFKVHNENWSLAFPASWWVKALWRHKHRRWLLEDTLEKLIRVRSTLIGFLHIPFISLYLTGEEV